MRYLTTIPLKLKTQDGEVEINPGDTFRPKNEEAVKQLLAEGKVRPLSEVMGEKYRELTGWLHQFDLTGDEIKETLPGLYLDTQDTIQRLDEAFINEDMSAFQDALERVKSLYVEALFKCGRRIAVKIWSEPLQAHIWVVNTDEDMHFLRSQDVTEAVYTDDEIRKLRDLSNDSLRVIHKLKEIFEGSTVEDVRRNDQC